MSDSQKNTVLKWYYRSQLDYFDQFINLFIAYNAWYKKVTEENNDRRAIDALKLRDGIWKEYLTGQTMTSLSPHLNRIVEITNEGPLLNQTRESDVHWDGIVKDSKDWPSLIEYWYRIRCNIFHGTKSPEEGRENELVRLAYESLNVFMGEIVRRMEDNFSKKDMNRTFELSLIKPPDANANKFTKQAQSDYYEKSQQELKDLEEKFKKARNLWEVDL